MKVICSYCRKAMQESQTSGHSKILHDMCDRCIEYFMPQWEGLSLGEYLDRFEVPVLILNEDARILAANQQMADLIGRPERRLKGLLGGEAMECIYARLEEGCGQTVHCTTCTVRNCVMHTLRTGETLNQVACYVEQDTGKRYFLLTTVKLGRSIQAVLEPASEE